MDRKALIDNLHKQLLRWNTEIDKLELKAQQASGEAKRDLDNTVADMKQRKEEAKTRVAELQHASDSAWEEIKNGADEAFDSLKRAFESAKSKF
ncbi:hypothetical protein [Photobacterium rosenbergii]|uniref:Coiled coil domain-containing protein n=1 Tax=Photobacterium rosenbergii TaxID=294936 RepID=A0ABU3ZIF1_9GAMM|nr:hypothetical protein [Photobacterium rosenbergii]MDV5169748.1 hypothetical protein [Photobacterium rosenbergii]